MADGLFDGVLVVKAPTTSEALQDANYYQKEIAQVVINDIEEYESPVGAERYREQESKNTEHEGDE